MTTTNRKCIKTKLSVEEKELIDDLLQGYYTDIVVTKYTILDTLRFLFSLGVMWQNSTSRNKKLLYKHLWVRPTITLTIEDKVLSYSWEKSRYASLVLPLYE